jgi:glycosyltransferase involved in cell wall biosynthesis
VNLEGVSLPPEVEVRLDVPPLTLRQLYAWASVVVVPTSGDGDLVGSDCSGTLVMLDALSMGRPVVVTSRASVREYVTPGLHVTTVPSGDVAALRIAILRALSDDPLTSRQVADEARVGQAHVRAERTTDHFAAGIANVFREVA